DKRADIFAFGAVLYELLTGKRAFEGETITETIAKVLESEPKWELLPENTPWTIRTLLRRCLTKDVHDRLDGIGNVRTEIKLALSEPTAVSPTGMVSAAQPTRRLWAMVVGMVVLGAVVAGLAVWLFIQPSSPEQTPNRFVIRPLPPTRLTNLAGREVAISPDGKHLVYLANVGGTNHTLYLRSLDDFVDRAIPGTEGAAGTMFFSPDSQSVAFYAAGILKKVSLTGGSAITLCQAPTTWGSGTWGPDDTILFSINDSLHRVSASGGEPELLVALNRDQGENAHVWPQFLPGGENILFTVVEGNGSQYHATTLSLETGEQRTVLENARQAQYLPTTGHLIYEQAATGNLMAVLFDPTRLEVTGDPVPVVQQVRKAGAGYVDFTISDNGTLAYVPGSVEELHQRSLVWVDREGKETLVTTEKREYAAPHISPDGKQLALSMHKEGTSNSVWIFDLEQDSFSRLTLEGSIAGSATWTSDGKWLTFQSNPDDQRNIYRQLADRSGPPERLTTSPFIQMPTSWSPDGQLLAFQTTSQGSDWDIAILNMEENSEPQLFLASSSRECCAKFSPDGKWLAYVSNEEGRDHVYVRPYPGPEVKFRVTEEEGGGEAIWSPDGTELFYRTGDRMMVVSIQTEPRFVSGRPTVLFEGSYRGGTSVPPGYAYYDISNDGQRFLMTKDEGQQGQIHVVLNWFEELKRLVPTP
ncbi:MAG: protein kinase, partial [Acidobacteria bacterium]|nr:protein kinase [Acidobacteriota bacterium]